MVLPMNNPGGRNRYGATRGGYGYVSPRQGGASSSFANIGTAPASTGGTGGYGGGNQRVNDARRNMYDLAKSGYDEARNNPIDALILEKLKGRSTTDVPYDEATINNLLAQGSEASAAAMENDQRRLDSMAGRGGIDATDPAYVAMQREAQERRNASNIRNRRSVESDARIENYNAQGRGLAQLGGANQAYRNRIDSNSRNLQNLYSREYATSQGGPASQGGPVRLTRTSQRTGQVMPSAGRRNVTPGARANAAFHSNVAQNTGRYPSRTGGSRGAGSYKPTPRPSDGVNRKGSSKPNTVGPVVNDGTGFTMPNLPTWDAGGYAGGNTPSRTPAQQLGQQFSTMYNAFTNPFRR